MRRTLFCFALVVLAAGPAPAVAAVIERLATPFSGTGTAIEDWESFTRSETGWQNVPVSIFSGAATITGPNEFIWLNGRSLNDPGTFGLGPFIARSHDGNQGYGTSLAQGATTITFTSPIDQFGGYWGSAVPAQPINFSFFDALGDLIGTDSVTYTQHNNNGTLEWFGWRSTTPIQSIQYAGSWVVNDSLRTRANATAVPEPSTGLALLGSSWLLVAAAIASRRRSRSG
jgi:hypothetical protein